MNATFEQKELLLSLTNLLPSLVVKNGINSESRSDLEKMKVIGLSLAEQMRLNKSIDFEKENNAISAILNKYIPEPKLKIKTLSR